jgi:hypothetical protein
LAEIGAKVRWCEEQTKDMPTSESGPRLNDSLIAAQEEVRPLYPEFVTRLRALGLGKEVVRREAEEKAWPLFREICAPYIARHTLEELERNALAETAGSAGAELPNFPRAALGKRIGELMLEFPQKSNREILGIIDSEYQSEERHSEIPKRFKKHGHSMPGMVMVGAYDCRKEHCAHNTESYLSRIRKRVRVVAAAISHRPPKRKELSEQ